MELFRDSLTRPRQRLREPEGAHVEGALLARKSVNPRLRRIAVHEAVTDETAAAWLLKDSSYRAEHPRIVRGHEENQRHDQKRGIQVLAPVELGKGATLLVPAAGHHFLVDAIPLVDPLRAICRQRAFVRQPDAAIQRNPIHDLRVNEMLLPIAHLPNACVRALAILAQPLHPSADLYPHIV